MAVPLVVYLISTAVLHRQALVAWLAWHIAISSLLIIAAAVGATWFGVPLAILAMGLIVVVLVAANVMALHGTSARAEGQPA